MNEFAPDLRPVSPNGDTALRATAATPWLVLEPAEESPRIDSCKGDSKSLAALRPVGGMLKRLFDITTSSVALLLLWPLLIICAALVRIASDGPVFFCQRRVGYGGELFPCIKFRSMYTDSQERLEAILRADAEARAEWNNTQKLLRDPRITPIGHFLRKTSLDELPQLFNVLRGEMSLVGPRPIVPNEIWRYGHNIEQYCRARPGITGPWQVSGRSNTSYDNRVGLDQGYVRNWSLGRDVLILFRTIKVVLARDGAV